MAPLKIIVQKRKKNVDRYFNREVTFRRKKDRKYKGIINLFKIHKICWHKRSEPSTSLVNLLKIHLNLFVNINKFMFLINIFS